MKNGEAQNCSKMGKKVGDLDKGKQLVVVDSNSKSKAKPAVEGKPRYDHGYPEPLAEYQDVVEDPRLFVDTLGKLHAAMSTKFMIQCGLKFPTSFNSQQSFQNLFHVDCNC